MNNIKEEFGVIVFGQFCYNSLGQIRSFGEIGIKPDVIWLQNEYHTPEGSRYINKFHTVQTCEEGLDYIVQNYSGTKKYFVSTDIDDAVSLLNERYDEFKDRYIFFNASEKGRLTNFLKKEKQLEIMQKFSRGGVYIPQYECVRKGDLPKKLNYPIITKAVASFNYSWKESSFICRDEEELLQAYESIQTDELILQEYIEKDNEVALEGISYNNGQSIYVPIQGEYLRLPEGNFGTFKRNECYKLGDELLQTLGDIFKEIGYNGVFEVEFIRDKKGELYFLEINFRYTQYNHALADMGINLCKLWIDSVVLGRINVQEIKFKKNPALVMNENRDFKDYVLTAKIGLFKWIKDFIRSDSYYLWDIKDIKYCISFYFLPFKERLKNRILKKIKL